MEAGRKDGEEETLQTAFKKLRVDAESLPGAASVPEAPASRASLDAGGSKPKLCSPKDNWHGCTRKTSRGASRTQRRRRSKSPILHPPKFTYCGAAPASSALSTPGGGGLKHQRLAASPAQKELSSPSAPALVFGSRAGFETPAGAALPLLPPPPPSQETHATTTSPRRDGEEEEGNTERNARAGDEPATAPLRTPTPADAAAAADFRGLSAAAASDPTPPPAEVYSFTGLRQRDAPRTLGANGNAAAATAAAAASSPPPRSCSEQARAHVDDITIEDLSGYMEFYLYIPKKMSHMAEMMYT